MIKPSELNRARVIITQLNICHDALTNSYELLVDYETDRARKELLFVVSEIKHILKCIEDGSI
jgi:hypothetical protein